MARKQVLKSLWTDRLTVFAYQEVTDAYGAVTHEPVVVISGEPCRLSFSTLSETGRDDAATLVQAVKIFCDNDLDIKPGSKIAVTRGGRTFEYSRSGDPGIFDSHQEIMLVPFRGWA